MVEQSTAIRNINVLGKIGYGILLPDAVFVAYQLILIGTTSGTGSWDGMSVFFGSIFIVPGLLVANCWVIPTRWGRRSMVFIVGLAVPTVIGAVEFFWLLGPSKIRWAIKSTMVAPFPWIWMFVLLVFAPLLISIFRVICRRSHGGHR